MLPTTGVSTMRRGKACGFQPRLLANSGSDSNTTSAPAALMVAKIMQPEVDQPKTLGKVTVMPKSDAVNAVASLIRTDI